MSSTSSCFLCASPCTLHSLSRCQCWVSVDSARVLTHPDDSSSSAPFAHLKTLAHSISQQIHILYIVYCILSIVYCLLSIVYCLLSIVCCVVLYCIVLYCILLYCIVLWCVVVHGPSHMHHDSLTSCPSSFVVLVFPCFPSGHVW